MCFRNKLIIKERNTDDARIEGNNDVESLPAAVLPLVEARSRPTASSSPFGIFGKILSIGVLSATVAGVAVGHFVPSIGFTIAIFLSFTIFDTIRNINSGSFGNLGRNFKPVLFTFLNNFLFQPFTIYALVMLFLKSVFPGIIERQSSNELFPGLLFSLALFVRLCYSSSFVNHMHGVTHTLVQVAINDALLFICYVPTLTIVLQISRLSVPCRTTFLSLAVFVAAPAVLAILFRHFAVTCKSKEWLDKYTESFGSLSMLSILTTVFVACIVKSNTIVHDFVNVVLLAMPSALQRYIIYALVYVTFYYFSIPLKLLNTCCYDSSLELL